APQPLARRRAGVDRRRVLLHLSGLPLRPPGRAARPHRREPRVADVGGHPPPRGEPGRVPLGRGLPAARAAVAALAVTPEPGGTSARDAEIAQLHADLAQAERLLGVSRRNAEQLARVARLVSETLDPATVA